MTWMWWLWLAGIIVGFVLIERYAFRHPERQFTLSRTVWGLGQRWPLSIFIMGAVIGGLAVHFFWTWCPA